MRMGRTFLAKQGGKCVITPAQGLNEYVDGGCRWQKAQELPVVLSPSLCISAVPLKMDFSDFNITRGAMDSTMLGETAWRAVKGKPGCPAGKAVGRRVKSLSWPCQREYCLQQSDSTMCVRTDTKTEKKSRCDGQLGTALAKQTGLKPRALPGEK